MKTLLFIIHLFFSLLVLSQEKSVYVKYTEENIKIDGILNEKTWEQAGAAKDFWEYFPSDSIKARQQVSISMAFNDEKLYLAIYVNTPGDDYVIPSLRRDFSAGGNDNITLLFDTYNDGANAFIFGTNPYGVKREGLLANGGNSPADFNMTWDIKWQSAVRRGEGHYIAEWAIPFSAFKYKDGETKWRMNSYHFDAQSNARNTWIRIPQIQNIFNLAFMGDVIFEKPLKKPRTPISIIPSLSGQAGNDFEAGKEVLEGQIGGDMKFSIGSSMNVDLTVIPDFSQVEVDQQITNLSRFEVSLTERRQFFIENSDLFGSFGRSGEANPFFSRRIGIATDTSGSTIENPILAGVRFSGKIGSSLRVGFLNVQTQEDVTNEIAANNNTILTLQQKVFDRSSVGFIMINRESTLQRDWLAEDDKYNRLVGIDYNLASQDNTWQGKYFFHHSFSPSNQGQPFSVGGYSTFRTKYFIYRLNTLYVGEEFRSDLGFIRRKDVLRLNSDMELNYRPKKGIFQKHGASFDPEIFFKPGLGFEISDYRVVMRWSGDFHNTSRILFRTIYRYTYLYDSFDPSNSDGAVPLPANTGFHYTDFQMQYYSDRRKAFSYELQVNTGQFFNGLKTSVNSRIAWRVQPRFSSSLRLRYDELTFPNPYSDATLWLVEPRAELTFSKSVFWTTLFQYSVQNNRIGVNSRLQWRFAPLSDLFVVYNDSYTSDNFSPIARSVNLKLTYRFDWFPFKRRT